MKWGGNSRLDIGYLNIFHKKYSKQMKLKESQIIPEVLFPVHIPGLTAAGGLAGAVGGWIVLTDKLSAVWNRSSALSN